MCVAPLLFAGGSNDQIAHTWWFPRNHDTYLAGLEKEACDEFVLSDVPTPYFCSCWADSAAAQLEGQHLQHVLGWGKESSNDICAAWRAILKDNMLSVTWDEEES